MKILQAADPFQVVGRVEDVEQEGIARLGVCLKDQRRASCTVVKRLGGRQDLLVPVKETADGMRDDAQWTNLRRETLALGRFAGC